MGYTYLLVIGLIVAFIDAFGIGANDNANNFANAIASGVLTPFKAVVISGVFELLGSILVGNNVAEAIRGRIINVNLFRSNPASLQLAMVCALIGSSFWIMAATRVGAPVSTTHSIIGAVLGVGVAAFGPPVVNWDYSSGRGFAGIVASWFISIAVSAVMAGLMYLVMKYMVLRYKNSFQRSLIFAPSMFGIAYGIMSLALVWKGTPKLRLENIPDKDVVAIVLGVWAVTMVLTYLWVSLPLYKYYWQGQDLQWYDYILGPVAPTRPTREGFDASAVPPMNLSTLLNSELDEGYIAAEKEIAEHNARIAAMEQAKKEAEARGEKFLMPEEEMPGKAVVNTRSSFEEENPMVVANMASILPTGSVPISANAEVEELKKRVAAYEQKENSPRKVWFRQWQADFKAGNLMTKIYLVLRFIIMFGIDGREIQNYRNNETAHLAHAPKWQSKTEDMYISLNVITSCMQAFAHGGNDVANAIGPMSTIVFVWNHNRIPGNSSPVEIWQLAYGGFAICCGLWFYGYNVMRVLGNNLTYQSPSRGFCMDVGSAITIIIASKEGFPVSTTQCITGATVGVGLANGEWRAVNWWLFARIFATWMITLPAAGTVAGLVYGWTAYSPTQPHHPNSV